MNRLKDVLYAFGVVVLLLLLVLVISLTGCRSGPQRVADASIAIRDNASSSLERFRAADIPEGVREQENILEQVDEVTLALPSISPSKAPWQTTVEYAAIAVGLVALMIIVWSSGLGQLIRTAIGWIPQRKRQMARLLRDTLDDRDPTNVREAVAALRASDSELDAAYRKLK